MYPWHFWCGLGSPEIGFAVSSDLAPDGSSDWVRQEATSITSLPICQRQDLDPFSPLYVPYRVWGNWTTQTLIFLKFISHSPLVSVLLTAIWKTTQLLELCLLWSPCLRHLHFRQIHLSCTSNPNGAAGEHRARDPTLNLGWGLLCAPASVLPPPELPSLKLIHQGPPDMTYSFEKGFLTDVRGS